MKYLICLLSFIAVAQSPQVAFVNFKTADIELSPNPVNKSISGSVTYKFEILKNIDSIHLDAVQTKFKAVTLNHLDVNYKNDNKKLWLIHSFKKGQQYELSFQYEATPKKALYFIGWDTNTQNQIWTQGQGKYTSNWLPSPNNMNQKIKFNTTIIFNKHYQVVSNGKLITTKKHTDSTTRWVYQMKHPMSSYLLAFAIGNYNKRITQSRSGTPLELYYYPKDSLKVEPTYRYSTALFDFLENEIGVDYPWQNYKQIPVKDFLYAGMENTSVTIFADSFVTDSIGFNDRNYVNVNAHELAHQWFGNLVTETSGTHHWLQEGFATYYALLAEANSLGNDHLYWTLYDYAQELQQQELQGQSTSLLNPKSSSLTFYKRGALVLFMLRETIGDTAFRTAIKRYLEKYKFKNVSTKHFIVEAEVAAKISLTKFTTLWIENKTFPYEEAVYKLKEKAPFLWEYEMVDCEVWNSKCDDYLKYPLTDRAKIKLISQRSERVTNAMFTSSLKVRQAIATYMTKIPSHLKTNYESLLNDNSYQTIEAALFNLWNNFENDRQHYLNKTAQIEGFSDKNIRILWLALALVTPEYHQDNKGSYYKELVSYTAPDYEFNIRQNAFRFLKLIKACNTLCYENLENAKQHHNWRFSSFAKQLYPKN